MDIDDLSTETITDKIETLPSQTGDKKETFKRESASNQHLDDPKRRKITHDETLAKVKPSSEQQELMAKNKWAKEPFERAVQATAGVSSEESAPIMTNMTKSDVFENPLCNKPGRRAAVVEKSSEGKAAETTNAAFEKPMDGQPKDTAEPDANEKSVVNKATESANVVKGEGTLSGKLAREATASIKTKFATDAPANNERAVNVKTQKTTAAKNKGITTAANEGKEDKTKPANAPALKTFSEKVLATMAGIKRTGIYETDNSSSDLSLDLSIESSEDDSVNSYELRKTTVKVEKVELSKGRSDLNIGSSESEDERDPIIFVEKTERGKKEVTARNGVGATQATANTETLSSDTTPATKRMSARTKTHLALGDIVAARVSKGKVSRQSSSTVDEIILVKILKIDENQFEVADIDYGSGDTKKSKTKRKTYCLDETELLPFRRPELVKKRKRETKTGGQVWCLCLVDDGSDDEKDETWTSVFYHGKIGRVNKVCHSFCNAVGKSMESLTLLHNLFQFL